MTKIQGKRVSPEARLIAFRASPSPRQNSHVNEIIVKSNQILSQVQFLLCSCASSLPQSLHVRRLTLSTLTRLKYTISLCPSSMAHSKGLCRSDPYRLLDPYRLIMALMSKICKWTSSRNISNWLFRMASINKFSRLGGYTHATNEIAQTEIGLHGRCY